MSKLKEYDSPEFVKRRNQRLVEFFLHNRIVVRIIGNENMPAVLFQDEHILPCYVKNFDLIFTDAAVDGNTVKTFKLLTKPQDAREELLRLIRDMPAQKVFRIRLKPSQLFVCGWNYLESFDAFDEDEKALINNMDRQPVFSRTIPTVYFHRDKAETVLAELSNKGYECEIL